MLPCVRCATPAPPELLACPHCNAPRSADPAGAEVRALPLILLSMGLSLVGCGDKEGEDSGDTGDTTTQPEYGTAFVSSDDGYDAP